MNRQIIRQIKGIVIRAMITDDDIMDAIALKGGSAIEEFYNINNKARASIDIDFSLTEDFPLFEAVKEKVHQHLEHEFAKSPYRMLDFDFYPNPKIIKDKMRSGYKIEFKVVSEAVFNRMPADLKKLRKYSITIDTGKTFKVEISSYEYCEGAEYKTFDDYDIKVYTPQMIACEKLRAICQQTREYKLLINSQRPPSARARDFYDIHYLLTHFDIDFSSDNIRQMLIAMFDQKQVPLQLIFHIKDYYDQHVLDEASLISTVSGAHYKGFRFYFDFVVEEAAKLQFQI